MELRKARIPMVSLSTRFVLLLHDMELSNPWHLPKSRHHVSQRMAHRDTLKRYERPCNMCGKKGVHKKCDAGFIFYHNKCGHTCIPASQHPNPTPIPNYNIPPTLLLLKPLSKLAARQGLCGHPTAISGASGCMPKLCGCGHRFNNIVAAHERQQHFQLFKKHKAWIAPIAPVETQAKDGPMDQFVNIFSPRPPPADSPILCPPPPPRTSIPGDLEVPSGAEPSRT